MCVIQQRDRTSLISAVSAAAIFYIPTIIYLTNVNLYGNISTYNIYIYISIIIHILNIVLMFFHFRSK